MQFFDNRSETEKGREVKHGILVFAWREDDVEGYRVFLSSPLPQTGLRYFGQRPGNDLELYLVLITTAIGIGLEKIRYTDVCYPGNYPGAVQAPLMNEVGSLSGRRKPALNVAVDIRVQNNGLGRTAMDVIKEGTENPRLDAVLTGLRWNLVLPAFCTIDVVDVGVARELVCLHPQIKRENRTEKRGKKQTFGI